eukprot:TRINITY_DN7627_c0_g1_i1.p1 TRINITY_DN7627_c0_g1~~TRINITY_DN7627_c0_g1_i1.p1  ORF type:complete len:894 (-),score=218.68 TRINITY_DN7627_c0_g1_i1:3-2303(-)
MLSKAEKVYAKALKLQPESSRIWYNQANLFAQQSRHEDAIDAFQKALSFDPNLVNAHNNLGNSFRALKRYDEALQSFRKAIALSNNPSYRYNLAQSLHEMNKLKESLAEYNTVVSLDPRNTEAYNEIGNIYKELGNYDAAYELGYAKAIQLAPQDYHYLMNVGALFFSQFQLGKAIHFYKAALELAPNYADAYSNLGNVYIRMGRAEEAAAAHEQATKLQPDNPTFWSNLGSAYYEAKDYEKSIVAYRRAVDIDPNHNAVSSLVYTLNRICNWKDRDVYFPRLLEMTKDQVRRFENDQLGPLENVVILPFAGIIYPDLPEDIFLKITQVEAHIIAHRSGVLGSTASVPSNPPPPVGTRRTTPLRVGHVSSDFRKHAVGRQIENLYRFENRSRVDTWAFSFSPHEDTPTRLKLEQSIPHFQEVTGLGTQELVNHIASQSIDVLIDLNGHTSNARMGIFAYRPAPIIVNYLGYPASTGADYFDYILSDPRAIDPIYQRYYSEHFALMPNSYQVTEHKLSYPWSELLNISDPSILDQIDRELEHPVLQQHIQSVRKEYGLPQDAIVYADFNQLFKIDPTTWEIWMDILKNVPNSVLWLLKSPSQAEPYIVEHARAHNLDPARIIFSPMATKRKHLGRIMAADVHLDTRYYNAHTVGTDVLWAGVPMVTMPLVRKASRVASSLVTAMKLPEMIVSSAEEYAALAIKLGTDHDKRLQLRRQLRQNRHNAPLFETEQWVRDFNRMTELMYDVYVARPEESFHLVIVDKKFEK